MFVATVIAASIFDSIALGNDALNIFKWRRCTEQVDSPGRLATTEGKIRSLHESLSHGYSIFAASWLEIDGV